MNRFLPRGATFGRRWSVMLVVAACACALVATDVEAGHPPRPRSAMATRSGPFAQRIAARQDRPQAPRAPREQVAPPAPAPVERPVEVAPPVDRSGKPGRLSPDERRALRQQINDAGRDLYRPPRP